MFLKQEFVCETCNFVNINRNVSVQFCPIGEVRLYVKD